MDTKAADEARDKSSGSTAGAEALKHKDLEAQIDQDPETKDNQIFPAVALPEADSDHVQASQSLHKPSAWEPKIPFTTRIPDPGCTIPEMYEKLLDPLLERDKTQCDAWKDEVQNLLIFAGLFSAVVTAFIIESYKGLQPDPDDQLSALLLHIANRLDTPGGLNAPGTPFQLPSSFSPTRSVIRINIFWFLSLILSLTVVLVGIISLQWLREHQRYDKALDPQTKFAIFNMRAEALQRWYVPHVFAALPPALQGALLFFFAGVIDFLLALSTNVAVPVIVVIGISIAFLLVTTVMPTLQCYVLAFPYLLQLNNAAPTPCPYKSPQSKIVAWLAFLSERIFRLSAVVFAVPFALLFLLPYRLVQWVLSPNDGRELLWPLFLYPGPLSFWVNLRSLLIGANLLQGLLAVGKDWSTAEKAWLGLRDQYVSAFYDRYAGRRDKIAGDVLYDVYVYGSGVLNWAKNAGATLDCVRGFRRMLDAGQTSSDQELWIFHCSEIFARSHVDQLQKAWDSELDSPKAGASIRRALPRSVQNMNFQLQPFSGPVLYYHRDVQAKWVIPRLSTVDSPDFETIRLGYQYQILSFLASGDCKSSEILDRWWECHERLVSPFLITNLEGLLVKEDFSIAPFPLTVTSTYIYGSQKRIDVSAHWTKTLHTLITQVQELSGKLISDTVVPTPERLQRNLWLMMYFVCLHQIPSDRLSTLAFFTRDIDDVTSAKDAQYPEGSQLFTASAATFYAIAYCKFECETALGITQLVTKLRSWHTLNVRAQRSCNVDTKVFSYFMRDIGVRCDELSKKFNARVDIDSDETQQTQVEL